MEQVVECLIAGGPHHGAVRRQLWDPRYAQLPAIASGDGNVCVAAARRPAGPSTNRFLLLHPHATGAQILAMVARLGTQTIAANADQSWLPTVAADPTADNIR